MLYVPTPGRQLSSYSSTITCDGICSSYPVQHGSCWCLQHVAVAVTYTAPVPLCVSCLLLSAPACRDSCAVLSSASIVHLSVLPLKISVQVKTSWAWGVVLFAGALQKLDVTVTGQQPYVGIHRSQAKPASDSANPFTWKGKKLKEYKTLLRLTGKQPEDGVTKEGAQICR